MKKDSIDEFLRIFEEAAIQHSRSTEVGDYKTANTCYNQITKAVGNLDRTGSRIELREFLLHHISGVRIWSAAFLLQTELANDAVAALEIDAKQPGIHGLNAQETLSSWKNGNLNL